MPAKNKLTEALENSGKEDLVESTKTGQLENGTFYIPPSRQGKKQVSGYFDKDVHHQLKLLSLETGKSIQILLSESLNHLFLEYKKPPIA